MKILIVSTFFPPLNSIASLRPYSWAKEWTRLGHEVTVLTMEYGQEASVALDLPLEGWRTLAISPPKALCAMRSSYRQEKAEYLKTSEGSMWITKCKGYARQSVVRVFQSMRRRFGIFSSCRMPDFTDLWIRPALKAIESEKSFDLVVSTSGPYAVHVVGHLVKRRGQAKCWIADYRDLWSLNHISPGLFPFNGIEKILEKKLLKKADYMTTVSASLAEDLMKLHGRANVYTIENGVDADDLAKLPPEPIFNEDGKYRIVYAGSIYPGKTDPSLLFETLKAMAKEPSQRQLLKNLEVIFVGMPNVYLQRQIEAYGIGSWVRFQGFVSRTTSLRMQRDAHALLFLPFHNGVLTGKLFEYLFSRTPILAVADCPLETFEEMIVDAGAGYFFYEEDVLKNFFINVLKHPCKEKSRIKPEFLERYERKKLARDLLELCENV